MANRNRNSTARVQASKGGENKALSRAMQGKRFSNAAGAHKRMDANPRKPKHPNRQEW